MKLSLSVAASVCLVTALQATEVLEAISITGVKESLQKAGKLKDTIEKTEVIDKKQMDQKQVTSLVEAIEDSAGVDVTTNCSMCGIKRVMLNGMKGEHTTVLSDGIPFHSTVSSYYGMDALGVSDVDSIEIARGSGASLTSPEAIGGTINIVSRSAKENRSEFDFAVGEQGYKLGSFVAEGVSDDKKTGVVLSGNYSNYDQVDNDHNGVNEAPKLENKLFSIKVSRELTEKDMVDVRVSHSESDVFGGPMVSKSLAYAQWGATGSAEPSFEGGDVNNRYNGDPMGTLESINTTRDEVLAKWLHRGDELTLETTLAYANAKQTSMYEGTDYDNEDETYFADFKVSQLLNESHLLTYGLDIKAEDMDGTSTKFTPSPGSNGEDDFRYRSYGLYLQDTWMMSEKAELNLALRGSKITTDFTGQLLKKNEIDKLIVVPRLHFRYNHNDHFVSRLSAGQGYRSPLTFFESEHGIIGDEGFGMAVDEIERSNNLTYALSYESNKMSATGSFSYTDVKNLAYIGEDASGRPTLFSYHERTAVMNADLMASYQLTPAFNITTGIEYYRYDEDYKALLFIAPVETQARIALDYEHNGWDGYIQTTWTASRDLAPYGYSDRYNDEALSSPKSTKAPAFAVVDAKISKEITKNFTFYVGVKNLFDYVQTDKESPLLYDDAGEYDVGHIWGPLRGRMTYAGIQAKF
ncbi:TonB-dependent receptor [Sulfurovum sp.]|jgi:outer membrane receptor protein involved in Fe transport|uniref:TonB-dependent receptor plug domain-containing protein n=1 Tax=Sulfurovum sp. TaxID=1969726 RepID=UPI002A35B206|nr:TonB-dependent receptor [Sulfurovum sp.]MDY0402474.1 TonB-dependent receptor [Sulfurovum sp.]